MIIKMIGDNCRCWKAGDEFDVMHDEKGRAFIECRAADMHILLDRDSEDCTDARDCPDGEVIAE